MDEMTAENRLTRWRFGVLCAVQIWVAHGMVFFVHEYAHSFLAAWLGFKSNPWMLHFGTPSFANLTILSQVNENVDYVPIFAQGHDHLAALIAFAGFGIGNALFYLVCLWLLLLSRVKWTPMWRLFVYWLCVMNVGNFYDYVPIRTFDASGDIALIVRGLGCSPWLVLVVLGIPTACAVWHLFRRVFPRTMDRAFPGQAYRRAVLQVVSVGLVFVFYGGVGLTADSTIAAVLAWVSIGLAIVWLVATRSARSTA